jgi:nitrite reductase/ring-hydroxylating ferredoxin subunit
MGDAIAVAKTSEISPGCGKVCEANGKKVAVFNLDGSFYAIDNLCIHKGGPLGEGAIEGDVVVCPWHNWRYNIKTGVSPVNPAAKVKTYGVKVENDQVKVIL